MCMVPMFVRVTRFLCVCVGMLRVNELFDAGGGGRGEGSQLRTEEQEHHHNDTMMSAKTSVSPKQVPSL